MKIGIIGLPQTGKKTFFQILTDHQLTEKDLVSGKPIKNIAEIKDPRFNILVDMYKPKKEVMARVEIELLPKVEKDTISKGDIFKDIIEMDAIAHVVRSFVDESVYHIDGSVDAVRDIDNMNSELILHDMLFKSFSEGLACGHSFFSTRTLQNSGKFLTAIAAHHIAFSETGFQQSGCFFKHRVAGRMAIGVVN